MRCYAGAVPASSAWRLTKPLRGRCGSHAALPSHCRSESNGKSPVEAPVVPIPRPALREQAATLWALQRHRVGAGRGCVQAGVRLSAAMSTPACPSSMGVEIDEPDAARRQALHCANTAHLGTVARHDAQAVLHGQESGPCRTRPGRSPWAHPAESGAAERRVLSGSAGAWAASVGRRGVHPAGLVSELRLRRLECGRTSSGPKPMQAETDGVVAIRAADGQVSARCEG